MVASYPEPAAPLLRVPTLEQSQHLLSLFPLDRGKVVEELIQRVPAFQIVQRCLYQHARFGGVVTVSHSPEV
jgi:hypothetical protein